MIFNFSGLFCRIVSNNRLDAIIKGYLSELYCLNCSPVRSIGRALTTNAKKSRFEYCPLHIFAQFEKLLFLRQIHQSVQLC